MNLRERFGKALLGNQLEEVEHLASALLTAYQEGPYTLPPDELMRQLKEYDSELVLDLVDRLAWEQVGQYTALSDEQRQRAVKDSTRLWTYSPVAQWIISLWTSYGLGEEIAIQPIDENESETGARAVWKEFWEADRNQAILATDRLRNISDWLLISGNRFFVFFISTVDGETIIRRVLQDQIVAIITDPEDDSRPLYYKRVWSQNGEHKTAYYRDWRAAFDDKFPDDVPGVDEGQIIGLSESEIKEIEGEKPGTQIVMLHVPFQELDESSLFGWPLLAPAGTSWFRGHREFFQNRLAVSRAVAAFVRRRSIKGGTRAVDDVKRALQSSLVTSGVWDTNPPPAAGSEDIHNKAITTEDLPMRTGASDAKADGEMFTWMVGLSGRLFPHYLGVGDAYRLATATSMEKPLEMQFSAYRKRLSSMFRQIVRIVLTAKEKYGNGSFETMEAEVTTDRLVQLDLTNITAGLTSMFKDIIATAEIPDESKMKLIVFSIQTILQAAGASNVSEIIDEEHFDLEQEEGLAEQSDKIQPRGQPLEPWGKEPVLITPEDVARSIRDWDRHMPDGAKGLLTARTLTPDEEGEGPQNE